ncbi:MAG: radical SAM protein [Candidatus Helarchaeota archaeon]|nr:radical SAM protein [Candidatus Helarchaeota archaeon]
MHALGLTPDDLENKVIIRPPVEAYSLIIGITEGCWWGRCRFCGVYYNTRTKEVIQRYRVRPLEIIFKELEYYHKIYGEYVSKVFLAGGSALSAPTDHLIKVLDKIKELFPDVKRISSYAKNLDILRKSDEELRQIHEHGLDIVYMGLESGSRRILKTMQKGTTPENMIKAAKKILAAGVKISVYIVLGLGGKKYSEEHALETAKVLNEMRPTIFRFRTLNILPTTLLWEDCNQGKFEIVEPYGILKEQLTIIENLNDDLECEVYNDHHSNYEYWESGNIKEDKQKIIKLLKARLKDPATKRLKHKHLLHM